MRIFNFSIILLIKLYKFLISPFFYNSCKFEPSCSTYAIKCFENYNFLKATLKSLFRIIKCNPWFGSGGVDDPIKKKELR